MAHADPPRPLENVRTLPARLLLCFPRPALAAVDAGPAAQARLLERLALWVDRARMAALALGGLALTGMGLLVHALDTPALAHGLVGIILVPAMALFPPGRRFLQRALSLDHAVESCVFLLLHLEDIDAFTHPSLAGQLLLRPLLAWRVECAFLLAHPQGQARLRAAGLSDSLDPATPTATRPRM